VGREPGPACRPCGPLDRERRWPVAPPPGWAARSRQGAHGMDRPAHTRKPAAAAPILLVGAMGAGQSIIGRLLAAGLGVEFRSTGAMWSGGRASGVRAGARGRAVGQRGTPGPRRVRQAVRGGQPRVAGRGPGRRGDRCRLHGAGGRLAQGPLDPCPAAPPPRRALHLAAAAEPAEPYSPGWRGAAVGGCRRRPSGASGGGHSTSGLLSRSPPTRWTPGSARHRTSPTPSSVHWGSWGEGGGVARSARHGLRAQRGRRVRRRRWVRPATYPVRRSGCRGPALPRRRRPAAARLPRPAPRDRAAAGGERLEPPPRSRLQLPATNPSTRNVPSPSPPDAITRLRCSSAMIRARLGRSRRCRMR